MARAEVNSSPFATNHSLPHMPSPLPKKTRLSLRRSTQILHKPYYNEDDSVDSKSGPSSKPQPTAAAAEPSVDDTSNVEMIDLTQDENASPNCVGKSGGKSPVLVGEESDIKVLVLGLPNCGNTCYVNSILQVLRYSPGVLDTFHSLLLAKHHISKLMLMGEDGKELVFFKNLHLLYSAMKRKEALMRFNNERDYCNLLMKPVKQVINSLRQVSFLFEEGEQHDAHELLITTIAAFSTACQTLKTHLKDRVITAEDPEEESSPVFKSDPSVVFEDGKELPNAKRRKTKLAPFDLSVVENLNLGFEGKIRHIVQCLECEKRLEREESFANLEVSIPEKISNEDCVDLRQCLSQTTVLSGENKFFCEECQHLNEARMSSEVIELPPILLLHFSWVKSCETPNQEKTQQKVIIPRSLSTSENSEVFCCTPPQDYRLFAVVLHIGRSTEGGHYVSFIRDASSETDNGENEQKNFTPKLRPTTQFIVEPEQCCSTEEIANLRTRDTPTKWLIFDDNVVSPVIIDEDPETLPYFNYLSITASPCMIFYHKT